MRWSLDNRLTNRLVSSATLVILATVLSGCGEEPPGSLRLHVADWVPQFGHNGGWRAVPVGQPLDAKADWKRNNDPHSLPPGPYDVYWVQDYHHESSPAVVARSVVVDPGKETIVKVDAGLRLDKADWVPDLGHEGWWGAVPSGQPVADRANWAHGNRAIPLAPGRYDVYWVQDYKHRDDPLQLASDVVVESGADTTLDGRSGIRLDRAEWVPQLGHEGWWGVVPTGKPLVDRADWTHDDSALLLPPGRYDVYWVQDYKHQDKPLQLATDMLVEPGKEATLDGRSGIRLDTAEWVPQLGHEGWWGVVPAGQPMADRVDWTHDDTAILLPPGRYDVYWVQDYNHRDGPMRLDADVLVEPGQATTVEARSGIRLEVPESVPDIGHEGWWAAVPAGETLEKRVDWCSSKATPLLVPPGSYDLYWKQDYNGQPRAVARAVQVSSGTLTVASPAF